MIMLNRLLHSRVTVINIVCVLLIGSVFGRMMPYYAHIPPGKLVFGLLAGYSLLFFSRPLVTRWLGDAYIHLYIILQMGITLILLTSIPSFDAPQDFFAILFVPLCMQVMWHLPEPQGIAWVTTMTVVSIILAIAGYGVEGIGYSLAYGSVFILVSVFTSVTRRSEEDRDRSQALLVELQAVNTRLEDTSRKMEQLATVEERSRLARELHDSVSQTIFSLTLTAQAARLLLDRDPSRVPEQLDKVQTLSKNALAEMRTLIQQNKPLSANDGLPELLRKHADERQMMDGLTVHLDLRGNGHLPPTVENGWFRVAQESLNNIVKHAEVKEAWLTLDLEVVPPFLCIEDHGKGFSQDTLPTGNEHIGLGGMRERILSLGGNFTIKSMPGEGTQIRVENYKIGEEIHA